MTANGDRYYRDDQLREIARRLKKASIDADLTPGGELHCELELYAALFRQRHVHGIAALLHYLTGLPVAEVAERIGRTRPAAVGLRFRGLKRLRELLHEPGESRDGT